MAVYKKHIAVNTRLLLKDKLEGIGWFSYEVLKRLVELHPEVKFSFFFDRPFDDRFVFGKNVDPYVIPPQARHPILWHIWFHVTVRRKLRNLQPDLFYSPEFYLTNHPTLPQVSTIHDLAYEHFPKDIPPFASWHVRRYSPRYARLARHIITVSAFSKLDIINLYGIPPEKITVAYNGCNTVFTPIPEKDQIATRQYYTEGDPFFHFVGTIQPRKNIETLLKAFDLFKIRSESPVRLLIVGRKGWQYDGAMQAYENMKHKASVQFTGYLPTEALNKVYGSSLALCYVPYLEGFGIPPLEAMYAGTAVIASEVSSLPEVCGDAAAMVNPFDIEGIANAMKRIWQESAYRNSLIWKGQKQREKFSWDKTAKTVWGVLSSYL